MARFRSRTIEIEAVQWTPGLAHPGLGYDVVAGEERAYVTTAHDQRVYLSPGDWIIDEPITPGRHYPCKPDVFATRYEPAVQPAPAAAATDDAAADSLLRLKKRHGLLDDVVRAAFKGKPAGIPVERVRTDKAYVLDWRAGEADRLDGISVDLVTEQESLAGVDFVKAGGSWMDKKAFASLVVGGPF